MIGDVTPQEQAPAPTEVAATNDAAQAEVSVIKTSEAAKEAAADYKWFYDDNVPGVGERPEWLKGKYKNATDQAKAYAELEKKLGAFKGAPEEYSLALPNMDEVPFDANDPILAGFVEKAKAAGASQEFFTEMLGMYHQAMAGQKFDVNAEFEKLGPNGKQDVQIIANWANSVLSPDEYQSLERVMVNAEAVKLIDKFRRIATGAEIPAGVVQSNRESRSAVLKDIYNPLYEDKTPAGEEFRMQVRRRLAEAKPD